MRILNYLERTRMLELQIRAVLLKGIIDYLKKRREIHENIE